MISILSAKYKYFYRYSLYSLIYTTRKDKFLFLTSKYSTKKFPNCRTYENQCGYFWRIFTIIWNNSNYLIIEISKRKVWTINKLLVITLKVKKLSVSTCIYKYSRIFKLIYCCCVSIIIVICIVVVYQS